MPSPAPYVTGAAPITFISEDSSDNIGKQYQIPLAALSVDTTTLLIDATTWFSNAGMSSANQKLVTNLIASLLQQGFLTVVNPS